MLSITVCCEKFDKTSCFAFKENYIVSNFRCLFFILLFFNKFFKNDLSNYRFYLFRFYFAELKKLNAEKYLDLFLILHFEIQIVDIWKICLHSYDENHCIGKAVIDIKNQLRVSRCFTCQVSDKRIRRFDNKQDNLLLFLLFGNYKKCMKTNHHSRLKCILESLFQSYEFVYFAMVWFFLKETINY